MLYTFRPYLVNVQEIKSIHAVDFRFQSTEHTQTHPISYTWLHVRFVDPQFSVSVIHEAAKAKNPVCLACGLV